ncbi:hypothetical protein ABZZ16_33525, partial [Streptomyces sp. NPDC006386]
MNGAHALTRPSVSPPPSGVRNRAAVIVVKRSGTPYSSHSGRRPTDVASSAPSARSPPGTGRAPDPPGKSTPVIPRTAGVGPVSGPP